MKETLLTILRDQNTSLREFRRAADKLAELVAAEVAEEVLQEEIEIQTPLAPAKGFKLAHDIVLLPILRAGIALLPPFMRLFDEAKVGFFGIRRNEETAEPTQYYENIPPLGKDGIVLILDPMIATGGSSQVALKKLTQLGLDESRIILVAFIAAPEGLAAIRQSYPDIRIRVVAEDERLNSRKFIVPGLGDFGDRYFGT